MGASNKISRNNKWVEVASKLGFLGCFYVKLKVLYMKYFDLIDCYYATVMEDNKLTGEQDQVDEVLVQEKVKVDQEENKWEGWKWKQRVVNAKRDFPLMCGSRNDFAGSKNVLDKDNIKSEPSIEEWYYEVDHDAAMLRSDESKLQTGYEREG
ncbi:hypothetical protein L1987_29973 [Smallanthus sonchifolius]|uniref:Uncharacterized protein n=1 Tax=Smallanthus sonchifolius TaxID=185202 RepID=A0ACB9I2T4_9ASTR|nr:hypothetical protein L1987_29973 [Smallanthus sonchifolius]